MQRLAVVLQRPRSALQPLPHAIHRRLDGPTGAAPQRDRAQSELLLGVKLRVRAASGDDARRSAIGDDDALRRAAPATHEYDATASATANDVPIRSDANVTATITVVVRAAELHVSDGSSRLAVRLSPHDATGSNDSERHADDAARRPGAAQSDE